MAALERQMPLAELTGDDAAIAASWLNQLRADGLGAEALEPNLYVSIPERAELSIDGRAVRCRPAAFSRSTGTARVEAPATLADPDSDAPLSGLVAIVAHNLDPDTVYRIEHRGAAAQVYLTADETARIVSSTTIWGTPTHETVGRRPRTPIVTVPRSAGEPWTDALRDGAPVSIATWLREGWEPRVLPHVEIRGAEDPEEFVLVHGGDAAALASIARALHACRAGLKRSVRIAWWPARAESSFGASAWYADEYASDIDEWCIAHVSIDAPPEATQPDVAWMPEGAELCLEAIASAGAEPVKGRRPARASSYSFTQAGVSGLFGGRRFPGDLHAYVLAVTRLVTAPLHPLDYTATVLEIGAAVQRYQDAAGNEFSLAGVSRDLGALRRAIASWRVGAESALARHPSDGALRRRVNARMRRLARVLVPLAYARGERFDHDPVLRFSAVPRLEAALHLASVPGPMRPFVRAALVRERNRIAALIRQAFRLVT